MLDYFVAIGVALAGLLVVYYMFQSITRLEVVAVAAPQQPRSRAHKAPKPPRRNDAALDRDMEALIAREVARSTTSMRADIRDVRPVSLEKVQRKAAANKNKQVVPTAAPMNTEKQKLIDKEMGFQRVEEQPKSRRNPSPPQQRHPQVNVDEELSRKLGQFFSNSRKEKKGLKLNLKEEQGATSTSNGAHVVVRKDISNARTW
ncbi:hypothetical protein TraAM80_00885 [Trypanosoma rangeli]|uniref:Uncharacterized protein n=1 Tax=Trypanosoma rangeli TaxID=5698 RepID=A0A3R7KQ70_TRYRA|nr:uncharacterized protein TraAM80_00885 [Trypanosoma rangeli]RNF11439.1 hypothetical protein TraAM80_00885 [Trypanosoma rangeli]|eukprot:RNF11439.1 hypothetical protein TraAM80_00885 [Trypanosoma rangeli]